MLMREKEKGFTLTEVIVVLLILAVLMGILVPSMVGYIDETRRQKYLIEAQEVKKTIEMYLLANYPEGDADPMVFLDELSEYELTSKRNPLAGLLLTSCTKGAYIQNMTLSADGVSVSEMVYVVDRYRIELRDGESSITVLDR